MAVVGSWVPCGNDQARLTNDLRSTILQVQAASAGLLRLKNIMAQMTAGADYSTIETYFSCQVGSGQALHDVLGTASDALQAAGVQGLLQRFG